MKGSRNTSGRLRNSKRAAAEAIATHSPAARAITAIIDYHEWRRSPLGTVFAQVEGAPTEPKLADAARVISLGLQTADLTSSQLPILLSALDRAADRQSARAIRETVRVFVDARWEEFKDVLRDTAIALLKRVQLHSDLDFESFLKDWPRLASDQVLSAQTMEVLASDLTTIGARLRSVRTIHGDLSAAQRILCLCMSPHAKGVDTDELASIIGTWAGNTSWGQVHHRLLWVGRSNARNAIALQEIHPRVAETVRHLQQLRLTHGGRSDPDLLLADMAPESRSAWRRMLKQSIGSDNDLRDSVTEALLWYTAPSDDRLAQLAVMELYGQQIHEALARFEAHWGYIVRTRIESIRGLVNGQADIADLINGRLSAEYYRFTAINDSARSIRPRTWIGDAHVEQMIEATIAAAANNYASEFEETANSGEETHIANLFRDIQHQFRAVNRRIAAIAAENRANKYLILQLDYRIVGKREEGGPGVDSPRFSTDICLLVQAREGKGPPFARRASFLQAKRLHVQKGAVDIEHYPVQLKQLEDLTEQTASGYLLLIGPNRYDLAMPVLPARLVLDLIARGQLKSSLYPADLPPISKTLSAWLTYEAIGLWTGDWRTSIVERAEGAKRQRPFLLVEITAEVHTAGPEGLGQ